MLFDSCLAGTPFRGLIIRGLFGPCAYIGVPMEHCLDDMESLRFDCHGGVTFRGPGDGTIRPEGWYWYGWDYQHPTDKVMLPELSEDEFPSELIELLKSTYGSGKAWRVAEIEHDIIDVAVNVARALEEGRRATVKAINDLT